MDCSDFWATTIQRLDRLQAILNANNNRLGQIEEEAAAISDGLDELDAECDTSPPPRRWE